MIFANYNLEKLKDFGVRSYHCENCKFKFTSILLGGYKDLNSGKQYILCDKCAQFFQIGKYPLYMYSLQYAEYIEREDIFNMFLYLYVNNFNYINNKIFFDFLSENLKNVHEKLTLDFVNRFEITKYPIITNENPKFFVKNNFMELDKILYFFCMPKINYNNDKLYFLTIHKNFNEPGYNPEKFERLKIIKKQAMNFLNLDLDINQVFAQSLLDKNNNNNMDDDDEDKNFAFRR